MSELEKIVYTSVATIIGGVAILVIGQILSKFFIEAIYEQRNTIGAIADALIFYARHYANPGPIKRDGIISFPPGQAEAEDALRQHASTLMACTQTIPFGRELIAGILDDRLYSILALPNRTIGQPDR